MTCVTVWQPWASFIVYGLRGLFKDVENRSWDTAYRGHLLIHAGLRVDEAAMERFNITSSYPIPQGMILGKVVLHRTGRQIRSAWHEPHCVGWYLRWAAALPEPVPHPGQQGLFPVDLRALSVPDAPTRALVRGWANMPALGAFTEN